MSPVLWMTRQADGSMTLRTITYEDFKKRAKYLSDERGIIALMFNPEKKLYLRADENGKRWVEIR